MIRSILLFAFITLSVGANELRPIQAWEYEYISQVFPTAAFLKDSLISDSSDLTSGMPNMHLLQIFDATKSRVGFIREVYTSAGCTSTCSPLDFTLGFDHQGQYLAIFQRENMPLEKDFGADIFNRDDYKKLNSFLENTPPSYSLATIPNDLVDAVTDATKVEYVGDVVETAAMSCFKIYLYKEQSLTELINLIANE